MSNETKEERSKKIKAILTDFFEAEREDWTFKQVEVFDKIMKVIPEWWENQDCVLLNLDGFPDIPLKSVEVQGLIAELCRQGKCKIAVRWDWSVPHIFVNGKEVK